MLTFPISQVKKQLSNSTFTKGSGPFMEGLQTLTWHPVLRSACFSRNSSFKLPRLPEKPRPFLPLASQLSPEIQFPKSDIFGLEEVTVWAGLGGGGENRGKASKCMCSNTHSPFSRSV